MSDRNSEAAAALERMGYRWEDGAWTLDKGCHCNLDPGMKPLPCVLDYDRPEDCNIAMRLVAEGKGKESCGEWRPITVEGVKP